MMIINNDNNDTHITATSMVINNKNRKSNDNNYDTNADSNSIYRLE